MLAGGYALAAAFAAFGGPRPSARRESAALGGSACLLALVCTWFPSGFLEQRYLAPVLNDYAVLKHEVPVAIREGLTETIHYLRRDLFGAPVSYRLMTNSHSMAATTLGAQRYMTLFAALPVSVHPQPRRALLIGYGIGVTAKALTETRELSTIDIVETSRDIIELGRIVFPDPRQQPLRDPRVRVHIEDGRYFLQTTNRRFDLITGEPPPPKFAGVVSLYTREHFALIRDRLADGGMVTYWFPAHSLRAQEAKAILRAFCEVFQDCSLWAGAELDWLLLGTRNAQGPVSVERFTQQWRDPVVGPALRGLGIEVPEQLGALFLADAEDLRAFTSEAAPLTDDHPKRLSNSEVTQAERVATYGPWMDVRAARERFRRSRVVERLWPDALRAGSLPFFDPQEAINRYFLSGARGDGSELPLVHRLLTRSSLRTLPLWLLGSSASAQQAAHAAIARGRRDPGIDELLGMEALADRDYARAASHLRAGLGQRGRRGALYVLVYALCMAGDFKEAHALMEQWEVRDAARESDYRFRRFLSETFGPRAISADR